MWGEDAGIDISMAQKAENYHNVKKEYDEKLKRVRSCTLFGEVAPSVHRTLFTLCLFRKRMRRNLRKAQTTATKKHTNL